MVEVSQLSLSVICGGQSSEHDISILSAQMIARHALSVVANVTVIYVTHQGEWLSLNSTDAFINDGDLTGQVVQLTPGATTPWCLQHTQEPQVVDVVFPAIHGTTGEDGCLQGCLQLLNVPFIGAHVLGSAIGFHKAVVKQLWRSHDLPTCDWRVVTQDSSTHVSYLEMAQQLGSVLFVKPSSQGSSIGITRVTDDASYQAAVQLALSYDDCVLVEPEIVGREIECSVQGHGQQLQVSVPGEVIVHDTFYTFDAKYCNATGAQTQMPAVLTDVQKTTVQQLALSAARLIYCEGMARVDFFVTDDGVFLNEINTVPGYTDTSLYPANWEASGVSMATLLTRQITSAIEMAQHRQSLSRCSQVVDSSKVVE